MADIQHAQTAALKQKFLAACRYLIEENDKKNVERVRELAWKLLRHEFGIAFCGHFSAGKSRMINCLLGENLLPSSPIPTSANLVKVHAGEEYAAVFFRSGKARKYPAPYDYEMVRAYCRDGDAIAAIELSHAGINLPENVVILDTPGIDSVDDAHRIATESAIHLADLIFYVMDYNHVQSELNFMFTRELTDAGKEVYLVINQIDKHNEDELSFDEFKAGIASAFKAWGVRPAGIFYTSLLTEDTAADNEFSLLQAFLADRLQKRNDLLPLSLQHSLEHILREHLQMKKAKADASLEDAHAALEELPPAEREQLRAQYHSLHEEEQALAAGSEAELLHQHIQKIMDNAYLMPFPTRALAEAWLAACQPDFSVGLLFRKRKTAEERQKRLDAFYADILEKTKAQLEWHLKTCLIDLTRSSRIDNEALTAGIQAISIVPSPDLLHSLQKDGARLTQDGNYVMNYTQNVADAIKQLAKKKLQPSAAKILQHLQEKNARRLAEIQVELSGMKKYLSALKAIERCEKEQQTAAAQAEAILGGDAAVSDEDLLSSGLFTLPVEEMEIQPAGTAAPASAQTVGSPQSPAAASKTEPSPQEPLVPAAAARLKSTGSMDKNRRELPAKLRRAGSLLHTLPGLQRLAAELQETAHRLETQGFLITLFGAFSAGKSSFANALLGEALLPVSPNPTTAAINKIMPVDSAHPHGTVRIKLKDEAMLLADVNRILNHEDMACTRLPEALKNARQLLQHKDAVPQSQRSFLQALCQGYAALSEKLGTTLQTGLEDFPAYAAQEEKSCFVEWIEVYYDCALTRQNITLVDTPGADSINARHTNASFDFIRKSDAILFVTYYNHAFSRADREFLIQLGRVKDAFQLDKMFFIVNAIDLAESTEEERAVTDYVRQQLIQYGVRSPQLYSISSQQVLADKRSGKAKNLPFETAFYRFVWEDLAGMAAAAAERDYQRAVRRVDHLIADSRTDAAARETERAALQKEQQEIALLFAACNDAGLQQSLLQELDELLYYVRQRSFLRFDEFFRESFNPATLRSDGRNLKKALHLSLEELLQQMGFDLAQELRATALRLERFLQEAVKKQQEGLLHRLSGINEGLSFSEPELAAIPTLEFESAFQSEAKSFSAPLQLFKSPHDFFEDGGSRRMAEALSQALEPAADLYLSAARQRLADTFQPAAANSLQHVLLQLQTEADDFYQGLTAALDGGLSTDSLLELRRQL